MAFDPKAHLEKQLGFLQSSCGLYDAGDENEAVRMANAMVVMLFDKKPTFTSVLTHLGVKDRLRLLSTGRHLEEGQYGWTLGIINQTPTSVTYIPDLGKGPSLLYRQIPVMSWWNEVVFAFFRDKTRLSRGTIIRSARDNDGGGHVDAKLNAQYEALASDGAISGAYRARDGELHLVPFTNAHLTSIRQMAWELLNSRELVALAA